MRGETAFIRGLTSVEKKQIRARVVALNLGSENSYWLKIVRDDLAHAAGQRVAAPVDIARAIMTGNWPPPEPSDA